MGANFLHNGFPQCVQMNSGFPAARIYVHEPGQPRPAWAASEFVWNAARKQFKESH